jgi:hypothetical protein
LQILERGQVWSPLWSLQVENAVLKSSIARYPASPNGASERRNIGSESAGARTTEIKSAVTSGPKVIVLTGDANDAPVFIRALMPAWEHNRYALTLVDPPSLSFWWKVTRGADV